MEHGPWHCRLEQGFQVCLLILASRILFTSAYTLPDEAAALSGLASNWQNPPQNWVGADPCGSNWVGIICSNYHITEMLLSSLGIIGNLSGEIQYLPELVHLDLSYNPGLGGPIPQAVGNLIKLKRLILIGCSFVGSIPAELGKLSNLLFLSLNSNKLHGEIPGALGNLSKLYWLDITANEISGSIPVSNDTNPGFDMLTHCNHFHFGNNKLSGPIPPKLFHSEMTLIHVLFDNNHLSGIIPTTLGLVKSLEAIRLDRNSLSGPVPTNLQNLTNLVELHLSNNQLTGPLPNLTGMDALAYLDLSNNSFDKSGVPSWFSTLPSLTTLILEYLEISGQLPTSLFNSSPLQTAKLKYNQFNGTLDLGTQYNSQLSLVDLQHNDIQYLKYGGYSNELILVDNPYCNQGRSESKYCTVSQQSNNTTTYSTPVPNCGNLVCSSDQELSSICQCSYPYRGTIYFWFLKFLDINNSTHYRSLEDYLMKGFYEFQVPVSSVSVQNPYLNDQNYLQINLKFFPASKISFDESDIIHISYLFNQQNLTAPPGFGPYYFIGKQYGALQALSGTVSHSKSKRVPLITVGGVVVLSAIICLVIFTLHKKKKAKKAGQPVQLTGSWNGSRSSSSIPLLKGPRLFSFDEIKKCTKNFSEDNDIGTGGYGKVYRGVLADGQVVAVKRARQGSMQGNLEFKTEIEMLSRVHHRNLVSLVGFCFEQNEQIVVYEYIPNGTLKESLSGKSGIRLDWRRRLRIALGAARGLSYLHELTDPPIVHRDIKSNNILLDHRLNAKVSDFGLSRALCDDKKGYITTQVKGTMGYLDPEYYMSQQLTEKSDVYSFGVLLLEIVTARRPIEGGRYIVREVRAALNKMKELCGLDVLLDPVLLGLGTALPGFEKFIDLAIKCVEESGMDRPSMSEVVKEIESILQLAGINPNAESASTSTSFGPRSRAHPYSGEILVDYSGGLISPRMEPK